MSLYEVTLRMDYFSQEIINRFHYYAAVDAGFTLPANGLAEALGINSLVAGAFGSSTLMGKIQGPLNTDLHFTEVEVKNMYSATDFYTVGFNPTPSGSGAIGGDHASPAFAYGFVSNRITLAVRRGHKRFAGVAEAGMNAGGVVNDGGGTLAALATQLGVAPTYVDGMATLTYVPCVLHFDPYVTPSGKTAYQPFPTEATQLANAALGVTWTLMPDVRTQRSRQYGRGR